jgi:hypothetical protein
MEREARWHVIATILIGAAFLALAAIIGRNTWTFLAGARTAQGIVVGVEPDEDGEGSFPVISFTTPDGKTHRFRGALAASLSPQPGERVDVVYHPNEPSSAKVKGLLSLWMGPLVAGGFGVAIVGVGLAVMFNVGGGSGPASAPTFERSPRPEGSRPCPRCGHSVGSGTLNCPRCFAPTS